jgi:hypothetical protein
VGPRLGARLIVRRDAATVRLFTRRDSDANLPKADADVHEKSRSYRRRVPSGGASAVPKMPACMCRRAARSMTAIGRLQLANFRPVTRAVFLRSAWRLSAEHGEWVTRTILLLWFPPVPQVGAVVAHLMQTQL